VSHYREITKLLRANVGAKRLSNVFDDFVEMAALTFRNAFDRAGHDEREAQYLRTAGGYSREQLDRFAHAVALVVLEMKSEPSDVLGRLYMELDLGNEHLGQFFTSYDLARLGAAMMIDSLAEGARSRGFVEFYEPTCGAGVFIIAVTQGMREAGLNYQTQLHVTAEDVSRQAVYMAYIHLTLLHVPALVYHRNTITQEIFDIWRTPAHVLGGWARKLRHTRRTLMSGHAGNRPTRQM
jgi:hypothetical protein